MNNSVSKIPVKVIGTAKPGLKLHLARRAFQAGIIAIAILIPASGLFRIDPVAGALVVLNRQIWFSDFFLIFGLWIMIATGAVMLYSTAGTVFCGWACPQNTMAEWANYMTRKLLGKRAELSLEGNAPIIAASKKKILNYLLLGASFVGGAMFLGIIPLFYFYPPSVVWDFFTFKPDPDLARSLHWIYFVCVVILLLDISVIRHFWCRFSCIYRVWQHFFRTKQTLHVSYDQSRSDECAKCNYCVTACFIDLDPRKTEVYDSCINCGECINACDKLHAKDGTKGLLKFEFGERQSSKASTFRNNMNTLANRINWTSAFTLLGVSMFAWGLYSYSPFNLSADRYDSSGQDYQIEVANKRYNPAKITLHVTGLPQGHYQLDTDSFLLDSAKRRKVTLHIDPDIRKGVYRVFVWADSDDGWQGKFAINHVEMRGMQ
ncbi:MAG: 4Fe-4S binding protein [Burkholderiales bacterium]|nr:4Fe-4S binding protein [Burkholderiales bacterium]